MLRNDRCFGLADRWLQWALLAITSLSGAACDHAYCQSGPKYGTQCLSLNDVEWQGTQQREEDPRPHPVEPSPGCVLLTSRGLVQQPLTPGPRNAPSPLPKSYLMSGACVPRQQPVYGAVR